MNIWVGDGVIGAGLVGANQTCPEPALGFLKYSLNLLKTLLDKYQTRLIRGGAEQVTFSSMTCRHLSRNVHVFT